MKPLPKFDPYILRSVYEQDDAILQQTADHSVRQVVEWKWANGTMFPAEPFWKERFESDSSSWHKVSQRTSEHDVEHGFDVQSRILFSRGGQFDQKICWLHELDQITCIPCEAKDKYGERGNSILQFKLDGSRLVLKRVFRWNGAEEVQYYWENDRLQRSVHCKIDFGARSNHLACLRAVEAGRLDASELPPAPLPSFAERLYEYDSAGSLLQIWRQEITEDDKPKGNRELEYKRKSPRRNKGPSTTKLLKDIETQLTKNIPVAVQQANITSAVYAVFICYCAEDPSAGWPPHLIIALDSYRQQNLNQYGSGSSSLYYELWHPQELDTNPSVEIESDKLADLCEQLVEFMPAEVDYAPIRKMLRDVAARLNDYDWSRVLQITDDFIVAAVDASAEEDPIEDIKAASPNEKIDLLLARGLLP